MNAKVMPRSELKHACLGLLDRAAVEHPCGHQGKLAARYIIRSASEERIELMFEKGDKSKANLWITRNHAQGLLDTGIEFRDYPASSLYQESEPGQARPYGRHAALKPMRGLARADLVRFTVERAEEMELILGSLAAI